MDNQRILELSEKINNQTATEEEITEFTNGFTDLLSSIRKDIVKE